MRAAQTILLVGHRGSGKTTLAEAMAPRGYDVVDLDAEIEKAEAKTCAEIIAIDETRFRELERTHLARILSQTPDRRRIVVLGAGCFPIPPEPLCVWIFRDGWWETAREERARLRPAVEFDEEVAWMRATREPRWAEAAHLRLDIARGRTRERAVRDLATLLEWAEACIGSPIARKTWMVPGGPEELERARLDAKRFELAGLELRSDFFGSDVFEKVTGEVDFLASLRSTDTEWIDAATDAQAFDVDIDYLPHFLGAALPEQAPPRPLILSTHPPRVEPDDVAALVSAARQVERVYPDWARQVVLKYAPAVDSFDQLGLAMALIQPLLRAKMRVTFLPQGERFAWCRPILASRFNATNYLPVGRVDARDKHAPPSALDLQGWLPHLVPPTPTHFRALIGDPVARSQGDVWHRRAALASDEPTSTYLKIAVRDEELESALELIASWGIHGLSVTSPHKRRFPIPENEVDDAQILTPEAAARIEAAGDDVLFANTVRWDHGTWRGTDTDHVGMLAALAEIEAAGIGPGSIAVFGAGGVSPAVLRAIEASDWVLAHHTGARDGWSEDAPGFVNLIVNAAGNHGEPHANAPRCQAWLDLHYYDVAPPPEDVAHFIGDRFFEAQAEAQREYWGRDALNPPG